MILLYCHHYPKEKTKVFKSNCQVNVLDKQPNGNEFNVSSDNWLLANASAERDREKQGNQKKQKTIQAFRKSCENQVENSNGLCWLTKMDDGINQLQRKRHVNGCRTFGSKGNQHQQVFQLLSHDITFS